MQRKIVVVVVVVSKYLPNFLYLFTLVTAEGRDQGADGGYLLDVSAPLSPPLPSPPPSAAAATKVCECVSLGQHLKL